MPTEGMVGIDIVSLLKTMKRASELALEGFEQERTKHDPANFSHAAECLAEVEELIGGYKLPLFIEILKGAAKREEKKWPPAAQE